MLPPVLEIYVVSHPGDTAGPPIALSLLEHFRGTTFSGLIGGAVDVYVRSESEGELGAPPRSVAAISPLPYGIPAPALTAIVLVAGNELADAVATDVRWHDYLKTFVQARADSPQAFGVFVVNVSEHAMSETTLSALVGQIQQVAPGAFGLPEFTETLTRDVAQGIAQLADPDSGRITAFISHTKRASLTEQSSVSALVEVIRKVVGDTRLNDFFDASDIQPNEDWAPVIEAAAATGALLAVRTDLYSSRQWCQREVLTAKRFGMPVVVLDALTDGEERGSFLMDHVPRTPCRQVDGKWSNSDVRRALGQLVDECLKRALWRWQKQLAIQDSSLNIDWWAPHAPEPATFLNWLNSLEDIDAQRKQPIVVLHPDPPLGPDEVEVLRQVGSAAQLHEDLDFLTPRGLAARGG